MGGKYILLDKWMYGWMDKYSIDPEGNSAT